MNWIGRARLIQARTGKTYHQVCKAIGSAGGKKAAENKRLRREEAEKLRAEQQRQVDRGLNTADAVPDNFTSQDRYNIRHDEGAVKLRALTERSAS